jgi:hypothetical protein
MGTTASKLGPLPIPADRMRKRYKRRASVLITTNRTTALTMAIVDRLMHRSVLVRFEGRSYRPKQASASRSTDMRCGKQRDMIPICNPRPCNPRPCNP